MIDVSDEVKQAYDISTTQIDKIIVDSKEYKITNVQYYDDVYEEGNIIGTAIARCLEFEIENIVDLEGKEVEYLAGIKVNNSIEWISLGNFIIQDVDPNDTTNINKVTAMDYMLKTNTVYNSTLNYSNGKITLLQVMQEACTNSNLVLATTDFVNKDFIVDSNQFTENALNRQVIQAVAQISGTVSKIKNDNKLYLINPNEITNVSKVFTLNNYEEAEIKRNTHPINLVSLGMKDIEGENITLRDEESINKNGENSLVINDNPFAYTQAKREQLITALFNTIKGFEYKSYTFKCQGLPYLETMDKVQFKDKEGNTYDSYVFRFNYKSPNGLESTIEAPSIIKATVNYQNVPSALDIAKRTEILVDKQNQTITSVVSNVAEQNQKISQVTQTVNELNSKISDIADITTSKESVNAILEFEAINQSEPIYIDIHPVGTNIAYLYPHSNLFPSATLYPKVRTLRFTNTTTNEVWDYELPDDLLIYDSDNYDEFLLDYDSQTVMINKRCGWNEDGSVKLLDNMITNSYEFPSIQLTDGDYKIELLGYSNAYMLVRLMAQNIYTTQFATKAELNSEISQTASEIDISVNKKLENYSTTQEMNSAINVKADSITSSVSRTYATKTENANTLNSAIGYTDTQVTTAKSEIKQTTDSITSEVSKKVGNDEIISKINQSAEAVGIQANKIELSANDILNLIAGNAINLTSQNITITSDSFNVDKNGKVTCSDISITGGDIALVKKTNTEAIQVYKDSTKDNSYKAYMTNDAIGLVSGDHRIDLYVPPVSSDCVGIHLTNGTSAGATNIYNYGITTPTLTQTSKESDKKNFEQLEKALDIIKQIEIYKYNLKNEDDNTKKHIGFVIGDSYKYAEEVTSNDNNGVDIYSFVSVCCKSIQEQQQLIEQLQKDIKELKGESEE